MSTKDITILTLIITFILLIGVLLTLTFQYAMDRWYHKIPMNVPSLTIYLTPGNLRKIKKYAQEHNEDVSAFISRALNLAFFETECKVQDMKVVGIKSSYLKGERK